MPEIARLNTDAAKLNPERHFASPRDIVTELMLTRGEKIATLERWRLNILQQLAAANEGMATQGFSGENARILNEIETARRNLDSAQRGDA
jgi:hypothetical protein